MSWRETKDAGKRAFSQGKHEEALELYTRAISELSATSSSTSTDGGGDGERRGGSDGGTHTTEHQILLSNVIACRLKIGGRDMSEKAVDDAKKCIALDNKWPKAHVRLASAYIALGGHSNDACLSLQRALSLDRNYEGARSMLVKEMRRRNDRERTGENDSSGAAGNREGGDGPRTTDQSDSQLHPTEETPGHFSANPSAPPRPEESASNDGDDDGIDVDDIDAPDDAPLSLSKLIQKQFARLIMWFHTQSDDVRTLFKVLFVFLILYVALGGRFGLDYALGADKTVGRRGNYEGGNAYDKYTSTSSSTYNHYSTSSDRYQSHHGDRYASDSSPRYDQYASNDRPDNRYEQRRQGNAYDRQDTSSSNNWYSSSSERYEERHGRHRQADSRHDTYDGRRQTTGRYNERASYNDRHNYPEYEDDAYSYRPRGRRRGTSFSMSDGSMLSMGLIAIAGIVGQRFGINPFQAMRMANIMQGRRGRNMGYGAYPGGVGGGFNFGRRRFGRGRGGYY